MPCLSERESISVDREMRATVRDCGSIFLFPEPADKKLDNSRKRKKLSAFQKQFEFPILDQMKSVLVLSPTATFRQWRITDIGMNFKTFDIGTISVFLYVVPVSFFVELLFVFPPIFSISVRLLWQGYYCVIKMNNSL